MRMFQLACKHKKNSCDTLIFASALRHNNIHGSILLDAYVLPLTKKRSSELVDALKPLIRSGKILNVVVKSREEEILWKRLLPIQVECCRQTWHHGKECQHLAQGQIPLSTEHSQLSICSCGEGQDIDHFPRFQDWELLAKYATRVVIMPLSALPCIEHSRQRDRGTKLTRSAPQGGAWRMRSVIAARKLQRGSKNVDGAEM